MVGMKKTFNNTVHPFWVEHYKKKKQKKEKKNDTRTRQERQT